MSANFLCPEDLIQKFEFALHEFQEEFSFVILAVYCQTTSFVNIRLYWCLSFQGITQHDTECTKKYGKVYGYVLWSFARSYLPLPHNPP